VYSLSVVQETNLGSSLSAAGGVSLMQSVSVFGMGRLGSVLSSESWFRAAGCLSSRGTHGGLELVDLWFPSRK
jgi:hypothetical protein